MSATPLDLTNFIQELISTQTNNPIEDVHLGAILTTELNLTLEDIHRLVKQIEEAYNSQIVPEDPSLAPISLDILSDPDVISEIETVGDLIDIIASEIELG
ncbi:hypothetical protein FWH30_00935 [Microgenomates group bacterium]|nr:hypothetical protein [Microgenomates group bacterium]